MRLIDLLKENKADIPEFTNDDVRVGKKSRLSKDSVDDQIDSLLIKFESESYIDENDTINESFMSKTLKCLIKEQEEVLDPEAEELEKPVGSEEREEEKSSEPAKAKIDIDRFSSKIARLVMNFSKLLKVEAAIVNRAKNYLKEEYDEDYEERFLAILESQFDIQIDKEFPDYENPASPLGLGAYDAGSGGGS